MNKFGFFFVFTTLVLAPVSAWAVLDLHVQEPLTVYSAPGGGKEVSTLVKGDVVVISPNSYQSYRKVLVTYDGKRRAGYIQSSKIVRSFIRDRDEEERLSADIKDYKRSQGAGLSLVASYMRQGARTIPHSDGAINYSVSNMTSFTMFFSIFYDYPLTPQWVIRPYLTFRQVKFKGDAKIEGISSGSTFPVTITQNLFGLGLLAKRYPSTISSFWYGGAIELAKGSGVSIQTSNNISLDSKDETLPFYAVVQGVAGFDLPLGASGMYLLPDVRLAVIPNTKPFIMSFEAFISIAYGL